LSYFHPVFTIVPPELPRIETLVGHRLAGDSEHTVEFFALVKSGVDEILNATSTGPGRNPVFAMGSLKQVDDPPAR
jgi:hypothetical protein